MISEKKKFLNIKVCSDFLYDFCLNISHSKKNFARYDQKVYWYLDGFGGLVVSMLASGTQVCGFKPGRSSWIFRT